MNYKTSTDKTKNKLSFKEILFERNNLKKYEHSPKVDLWEEKDELNSYYMIRMEIPGIDRNQININVIDKQIVLVTNVKFDSGSKNKKVIYSECRYGKIIRRVKLPDLVYDNEHVKFKYEDGILMIKTIIIPIKKEIQELDISLDDFVNLKVMKDEELPKEKKIIQDEDTRSLELPTKKEVILEGDGQGEWGYGEDPSTKSRNSRLSNIDWADDIDI